MKMGFYNTIASENIKKNARLYVPRILAEAGLLGCFYIMMNLALDQRLGEALGGAYLKGFMMFGAFIIGGLSFILILYINSFLMKQRKGEYGLYNVLGMEKRHILKVLWHESMKAAMAAILGGLIFGILFYKLSSLLICKLLHAAPVAGFYYLNLENMVLPVIIFMILDLVAYGISALSIMRLKPVELMASRHHGEKEPRIRWVLLVIGTICLVAGYIIALRVKSPIEAMVFFFVAVALVIVGTYCLFVTGTTFVLKCLKKNKRYYYNKKHMPAVAGLLFRMKQNAVGLASIAILATGVLVMISTTVSLYSGVQDSIETNYPDQLYLSAYENEGDEIRHFSCDELKAIVSDAAAENDLTIARTGESEFLCVSYVLDNDRLLMKNEVDAGMSMENLSCVVFITQDAYNAMRGQTGSGVSNRLSLHENEVAFCRISSTFRDSMMAPTQLSFAGNTYQVARQLDYFPVSIPMSNVVTTLGIVLPDEAALTTVYEAQKAGYGKFASEFETRLSVSFTDEEKSTASGKAICDGIAARIKGDDGRPVTYSLDTKWEALENVLGMYGSFLFLGILLGAVCLFATILIIYYKQISEGYEDRERFQIMEKIGMETSEVKSAIGSQLMLQFFLPLLTAALHTAVAFPLLEKMLRILMLTNTQLFVVCTLVTLAVFALVYAAVYFITARTYYRIVHN
ncbi:MAG: ABC transporter permease [Lachnospiraceae bacterium]|nr:ABC transporter permease [Lachnospiraceae bacterium]